MSSYGIRTGALFRTVKEQTRPGARLPGPGTDLPPRGWLPLAAGFIYHQLQGASHQFELEGTFHDIRHTHATELLRMGVHPKIVGERLGQDSIQITLDTYSHALPDMQQPEAVAIQLDDALIAIQRDFGL
jgi:integrase